MQLQNNMLYKFHTSYKVSIVAVLCIAIGGICVAVGLYSGHSERIWANLLLCSYYLVCLGFGGTMFSAIQLVSKSGWSVGVIRISEAISKASLWFTILFIIILVVGLYNHSLYHHWANPALIDPSSTHYDPLIEGKSSYLNTSLFLVRVVVFTGLWSVLGLLIAKFSNKQDNDNTSYSNYKKAYKYAVIFCVIFGFTYPLFAFDAIMSIEAHWFSTMFGWYNLAGLWVTAIAVITLISTLLKQHGVMPYINNSHLHDLGKYLFGFSIFWAYTWLGQFLLIWYANIPEEVVWFTSRWTPEYKFLFWLNLVINLGVPLLALMTSDAKRKLKFLKIISIVIILGHWLDYYLMIMPGSVGDDRGFSYQELGIFVGFVGAFVLGVTYFLSKVPLLPQNHPFIEETLHHELENL